MRHDATLLTELEGMSRPAFRIARELALNSRSGLTVRFLAKKLELPEEEIEYLVDVNHAIFYLDLTKVKLVAEGGQAIRRIVDGLESAGDVESIFQRARAMPAHDFRGLEELLDIDKPSGKKAAVETLLARHYTHPESVVDYVATREFSDTAKEIFDIVWQSADGVVPVATIRTLHGGTDYEIEQALSELFQGFALFELFRFDQEDRLVRVAALLAEVRQHRERAGDEDGREVRLRRLSKAPATPDPRGLSLTDLTCRLVAAIAARPVRIRGDGELFREDRARLQPLCVEDDVVSLTSLLWIAQGLGWVARVDNELRVGDLEGLLRLSRLERHRAAFDWLLPRANATDARRVLLRLIEERPGDHWWPVMDVIAYAARLGESQDPPTLRSAGGHWGYVSPTASSGFERSIARSLEEAFHWMGVVDRAEADGESYFSVTPLGRWLLTGENAEEVARAYPDQDAELVVQPNFDIVAPLHDVDPLLTVPLDQFAERVSTGQVAVYRLTKDSFTRGLQNGHDGDAFVRFLLTHNRGGALPANVLTTLEDWRGGMKRVRVRTIQVIEADDPLVVADLMHRKKLAEHIEPLDPARTVRYSKVSKAELIKRLEKEGFVVG